MTLPQLHKIILPTALLLLLQSCKDFANDNYVAYFGGEITNPSNRYVLFCKNNEVIDTIPLKPDNTFFKKFDSLAPGLYSFKNEPEFQYIYFDKNDSLMVHVNSRDFDESVVFCGRGDEKNNFLMEMYLRNEKDKNAVFNAFDFPLQRFTAVVDSLYDSNKKFYAKRKETIQWNEEFDILAKASLNFPYYSKKELYPMIHHMRTGNDVYETIPKNYYSYRNAVDLNNATLSDFAPYVMYVNHMLNNMATIKYHNHYSEADLSLKTNISKLNIADTLIKNEYAKNKILDNIAFQYLLEDQNATNNQAFLKVYHKYSTDKSQKNEIVKIGNAIQRLITGKELPVVELIDANGKKFKSDKIITGKTLIFFWSENANSHLVASHKKIAEFKKKHPDYTFIAVNLDTDTDWKKTVAKYNFKNVAEYRCADFEDIKSKWAITKIHRTIIINSDKTIKNAFTNIFEVNFENQL